MDYKKAFYSKLEDCYLGVKIKDFHQGNIAKSGFSNLLKIKEQYFAHIKVYLDSQIEGEPQSHDIYNKLFTFFDSYLNESGTPFFSDTPAYKNIYAKVYSNSKDTSLFYKTQNLYYVKSDTLYQSLTLSDEKQSYEVFFDASEYKQNADNTKNKIIFKFAGVESINGETNDEGAAQILIQVSNQKDLFPELNNVFKQNSNEFSEEFLKDLRQNAILKDFKIKINEEELKKIFKSYKKQSEIDFFIHKNATAFLKEQFDLWMFSYLYKESAIQEWNLEIIAHLQRIKNIAYEVIKLIGDFENELKAVWLKPKFAKKVEYVFSLDVILNQIARSANLKSVVGVGGEFERGEGATSRSCEALTQTCTFKPLPSLIREFLELITSDKGFESQIKEWKELNLIDESFNKNNLLNDEKYKFLPLDTKHFSKEAKYKILSSFENLESLLNGELIKSDNFQALNTLMPKYQNKVDLIYIDPPYNTGSDGFIYADNFNHASWLSMMNNRLELSKELLNDKGSMFISIDDKEQARLKLVCDEVFGEENFVSNVIWEKKYSPSNDAKYLSDNHDFIVSYAKNKEMWSPNLLPRTEEMNARYTNLDNDPRGKWKAGGFSVKTYSALYDYPITTPSGKIVYPPSGSCWQTSKENYEKLLWDNRIYFGKNNDSKPQIKQFLSEVQQGVVSKTLWRYDEVGHNQIAKQEIKSMFNDEIFDTPKPEKLLKRICEIASNQDSIILDFFAGSGTSLATAQKLGRKWLGIEMGEHFYSVVIPRLKKVIAGFQSGISKECDYKGGGVFRYYELESYEEALKECEYVLIDSKYTKPFSCHTEAPSTCHTEALAEVSKNIESKRDISASPQYDKEAKCTATYKDSQSIYPAKDYQKAQKIIDYRKSRKLIDKLSKGDSVCLDMHTEYREEFDIFQSMANLMGWKIKRLFLDSKGIESCEFDNGEILNLESIDLAKYPKLKNLIWWE